MVDERDKARQGVYLLEEAILSLLKEKYREDRATEGYTPSILAKKLAVYRGTKVLNDMQLNDAIITGVLRYLMHCNRTRKIDAGEWILTEFEAETRGLLDEES